MLKAYYCCYYYPSIGVTLNILHFNIAMINADMFLSDDGQESEDGLNSPLSETEIIEREELLTINRIECKILKVATIAGVICVSGDILIIVIGVCSIANDYCLEGEQDRRIAQLALLLLALRNY